MSHFYTSSKENNMVAESAEYYDDQTRVNFVGNGHVGPSAQVFLFEGDVLAAIMNAKLLVKIKLGLFCVL